MTHDYKKALDDLDEWDNSDLDPDSYLILHETTIRAALTARQEPINQELLEALKGIKKFAISKMEDPSRAKEMKIFTDTEEAIARAEAQKGE